MMNWEMIHQGWIYNKIRPLLTVSYKRLKLAMKSSLNYCWLSEIE